jgi:peptidoglycan/xylan/chitin deacetylase (PgdA/CDA1 family)
VQNAVDAPVAILAYHRVADLGEDPFALSVHPDRFRDHLRILKSRHPILRLEDDLTAARKPSVVLTFDDGYSDNATTALPILEKEGVPATFFITSGYIASGRRFWWDELASLVLDGVHPGRLEALLLEDGSGGAMRTREDRLAALAKIQPRLKGLDPPARERWLDRLRAESGGAPTGAAPTGATASGRPLTQAELKQLAGSPVASVGAHGVDHPSFAGLSLAAQQQEMSRSKRDLEEWIGRPVTSFSFPFGERGDFTRSSIRLAAEQGFRRVAVNVPGQVHRWTSPMRLPRHVVRDWPAERFESELAAIWTR